MIVTDLKILRQQSKKFTGSEQELQQLIKQLEDELTNSKMSGAGLSAIQIGIPLNVAIIRHNNISINLYNAEITQQKDAFIFKKEGCLSIPNTFKDTIRFSYIEIRNGDGNILKLNAYDSIVAQHEIDHWHGVLFIDRVF